MGGDVGQVAEYPKIETLFDRDESFRVDTTRFRLREFGMLDRWLVTEKVDGTNVRVVWWPRANLLRFYGRTDNAQMPTFLLSTLQDTFTAERFAAAFPWATNEASGVAGADPTLTITLYGEGYGLKIQAGGNYRKDGTALRLFDVMVGAKWLDWSNVKDVAAKVGVLTVPDLGYWATGNIIRHVEGGFKSTVSNEEGGNAEHLAEGVVARTDPSLYLWDGRRLMWKLKTKDFRLTTGKGMRPVEVTA